MPGRSYSAGNQYRYGFNGKENDNEVKGEGNQQDYGMRISDPRLGRFLSVDPITKQYPELTPYQFASNSPIEALDIDGLEAVSSKTMVDITITYDPVLKKISKGSAYISAVSPNVPKWLADNIVEHNSTAPCENCIWSPNTITVGKINEVVERNESSIEADVKKLRRASASVSGQTDISITGPSGVSVGTSGINGALVGKANAILTGITWAANGFAKIMKNDQVAQIKRDASHLPGIFSFMNKAIDGEFSDIQIPDKFMNTTNLEQMAQYIFSGKIAYDYGVDANGNETQKENTEVMAISRKLLSAYQKVNREAILEKISGKINQSQNPVDQTKKTSF